MRCPRVLELCRHGNWLSTVLGGWNALFGFPLGLVEIFSLAPLQKINAPLCWYILGRVIFTLCSKQRNIKHQWTDGHIAHRWQHTTLLAHRAILGCRSSLKTCCVSPLEEHYHLREIPGDVWDSEIGDFVQPKCVWPPLASHRWSGWAVPQWISGKESHLFFMTFTPGGPAFLGRDDVGVTANANNLSECIRVYC